MITIPINRPLTEAEVMMIHTTRDKDVIRAYKQYQEDMPGVMIYLSPYYSRSLVNALTSRAGFAIYHTGIIVQFDVPMTQRRRHEVTFGKKGIFWSDVGALEDQHRDWEQCVMLGISSKSEQEIKLIIKEMEKDYPGDKYDQIGYNCHTFCNDLAARLGVALVPNKYTKIAKALHIPKKWFSKAVNDISGSR